MDKDTIACHLRVCAKRMLTQSKPLADIMNTVNIRKKDFMKKHYALVVCGLMAMSGARAQSSLFETTFSTQSDFDTWTVIDSNADGKTWAFSEGGSPSQVMYTYGAAAADDWLISPEITPSESGKVMVKYSVKGGSYYQEALDVYTGSSNTVEAMTNKGASYNPLPGDYTSCYFLAEVEAGVPFRIGFHCVSPADLWRVYVGDISVTTVGNVPDLKVTEIVSPATGNDLSQETVTVRITNGGVASAANFPVAFSIDGEEKARETVAQTLAVGDTLDYTFAAKADLSTPRQLYTFKAYTALDGDLDASNDTLSASIRHKAAASVPYNMGFESSEYTDDIAYYNLNEDSGNWSLYTGVWWNMAHTGYTCLAYNYDSDNSGDDWAILEPIKLEQVGTYVLRFWYSGDDNHPEKLAVYYGNGGTPDDMTNLVVEYAPFARGAYEESVSLITIDKPQTIYIGFKAFSDKDENWICVDDVQLYKASGDQVDIIVNSLSTPFEFVRTPNASDAKFELRNVGISPAYVNVTCKVDDDVKSEETVYLKAQEYKTVTVEGVLDGVEEGSHTFTVSAECDEDENADNNSLSRDIVVLGTPFRLYDFEDGQEPDDFTYRVMDSGTINPSAGSEFNDYGWGIIPVEGAMYGNYIFAGNTWIDGADSADRWLILPQVKVGEGDSYFVWDASSGNSIYRENYQVKVSDGSMEPADYWYTTEKEVTSEDIYPSTRGISLKKYAGSDVYVGIRLTSPICEFLAIDNLGFYGDVASTTGIESVKAGESGVDAPIYSVDGVKQNAGRKQLKKGVYIQNGKKFVVK